MTRLEKSGNSKSKTNKINNGAQPETDKIGLVILTTAIVGRERSQQEEGLKSVGASERKGVI